MKAYRLLVVLLALALAGCAGTVTPEIVPAAAQASFDGNEQNSGVVGLDPAGRGYIITPRARDRYNALVRIYGRDFTPPLATDAGVIVAGEACVIDREHLVKFIEMARWAKAGLAPRN